MSEDLRESYQVYSFFLSQATPSGEQVMIPGPPVLLVLNGLGDGTFQVPGEGSF